MLLAKEFVKVLDAFVTSRLGGCTTEGLNARLFVPLFALRFLLFGRLGLWFAHSSQIVSCHSVKRLVSRDAYHVGCVVDDLFDGDSRQIVVRDYVANIKLWCVRSRIGTERRRTTCT